MVNTILITYNGIPIKKGQKLKFRTEYKSKRCGKGITLYREHTGTVLRLTKSQAGVILQGVDIKGEYSRSFEELPELHNKRIAAMPVNQGSAAGVCA